ncbi:MAG: hypothetical protein EOM64_07860 [Erysipelotrichia bacterium]|nr:hypothetical protein [Erysipelotrichia bacterium]
MKQIYVCKKCGRIVISEAMQEKYCTDDGGEYFNTEISEEAWNAMSDAAKNNVIKSITGSAQQQTSHTQEHVNQALNQAGATIGAAARTAGANIRSTYEKSTVLYNNIGSKICGFAKIVAWVGIIISCLFGIIIMISGIGYSAFRFGAGMASVFGGLVFAAIGSLCSWIGSMMLYGFGHLILKTDEIADKIK